MKRPRDFRPLILLALMTPLFFMGVVNAQDTAANTSDSTTTLQTRLQARKDALKLKLTTAEQARLKLRCKAAQGLVSSLSGRITGIETSRNEVYGNVVNHLTTLSDKLKAESVDTTELNNEVTTLKGKIDTYKTDLAAYKQAVSDLSGIDCVSDPTGFKTMLETARPDLVKVGVDIKAIRSYVTDTIKPTLVSIHDQLATKEQTDNQ